MITWGAAIYVYLWLAGMAGGGYFAAFLAERFAGNNKRQLSRLATYMGIIPAIVGVILLVIDLGSPLRFWHLLTQFKTISPMSMGTWILLMWVAIAIIMDILHRFEHYFTDHGVRNLQRLNSGLGWLELIVSVLLITYTGVLLSTSNQTLWTGSLLLPPLFVASAISTGIAILVTYVLVVAPLNIRDRTEYRLPTRMLTGSTEWTVPTKTVARLWEAEAIVILIEVVVLIGLVTWLGASTTLADAHEVLNLLTVGILAAPFWVGVVLLTSIIPLALDTLAPGKELQKKGVLRVVLVSSMCVLLGALFLRAVIVVGGQM